MKIGLIADLHSNLAAIKAVLEDMPRVDRIICVGDLVGYAAEPNEVVDLVRSKRIQAVMGDHDHAAVTRDVRGFNSPAARAALWTAEKLSGENLEFLSNLPTHLRLDFKQRVYVVHGSPLDPLKGFISRDHPNRELAGIVEDVDAEVVVLGHTHVPMKRMVLGKLIVNPGAVGQPRDRDPRASYAVLTLGEKVEMSYSRVDYDIEGTAAKVKAAGLPEELAARLFFGW